MFFLNILFTKTNPDEFTSIYPFAGNKRHNIKMTAPAPVLIVEKPTHF